MQKHDTDAVSVPLPRLAFVSRGRIGERAGNIFAHATESRIHSNVDDQILL